MLKSKEKYREWCCHEDVPLFLQSWWMDAVCIKGEWDVFLYEKNGEILAAMPFHLRKKVGLKFIIEPQLTQYSGIWIKYPENCAFHKRALLEKEICFYFIEKLKNIGCFFYQQTFSPRFTNWQPFYWKGFRQTTRYTYRINDLSNLDKCFENFSYAKQKHIKKANDDLQIDLSISADEFYDFHRECLGQKNATIEYSQELLLSIYDESAKREQGKIIALKDKNKIIHSALFVVWDKNCAYALISAINPQFKSDGASTKMFWEAIQFVSDKTEVFDFEGSMIEGVAQSFQQFGAEQVPYFCISKSYSRIFTVLQWIKQKN